MNWKANRRSKSAAMRAMGCSLLGDKGPGSLPRLIIVWTRRAALVGIGALRAIHRSNIALGSNPVPEFYRANRMEENSMAWTTPKIEEICLGMEINMYYPADEREDDLF
ncbi:MAG: pyrroloquinoline quinone precursor peptide PqqA [Alphaproteobacteria bacterium]